MTKNKALKVVNVLMFILLISQFTTGFFGMKLPREVFVWGHKRAALLLLAVAAIHLFLNWGWVKTNYFKKKS